MGFFGGSTTVVASTLYNMAGPEEDRVQYLKTIVVGNVISHNDFGMGETLNQCYLSGPGIHARSFYRWALLHYTAIGVPPLVMTILTPTSDSDILPNLVVPAGDTAQIVSKVSGAGDIEYWGDQWVLINYPDRKDTDYTVDYDGTNVTVTFTIDGVTGTFVPDPVFVGSDQYLYVLYNILDSTSAVVGQGVWIYKIGSGSAALDGSVTTETNTNSHFFPFIPIRNENTFLSESYLPDIYELSKKAYRKATGGHLSDFDKLIDKIKDNANLDDIDYAYIVYGVPLNAMDNSARKYLFDFFKGLIPDVAGETNTTQIEIISPGDAITKLHMTVDWTGIVLSSGSGLKKADAQVQEVWLEPSGDDVLIHRQFTTDYWETLTISGLVHNNWVYKKTSVKTKGIDALADADESGFLVPLHYETVREMSLIDSTQMMTASVFIVFNSFEVVKQKWYETIAFKVFIFIVIIAISVATMGAAAPGLLGTAGSVGSALGFSGTMAAIVGAVANALAAMVLVQLIQMGATAVFGAKIGAIVAVIATIIAMQVGTGLMNGLNMSAIWGNMMSAQNLIGLTSAVGNGVAGYMQASAQGIIADTQNLVKDYQAQSKQITELYAQNIGYGHGMIDPLSLTDVSFSDPTESDGQFLMRTMLTGSDIAQMSMDMLTNFADYTTSLELAGAR